MIWNEAKALILQHIVVGTDLNPALQYRNVVAGPAHICNTYDYNGDLGFQVQIGANSYIELPFSMLETVFEDSINNNRIFNKDVFRVHYPTRAEQATGHPCHIHVIGKIFELSGVANQVNSRNYLIL